MTVFEDEVKMGGGLDAFRPESLEKRLEYMGRNQMCVCVRACVHVYMCTCTDIQREGHEKTH